MLRAAAVSPERGAVGRRRRSSNDRGNHKEWFKVATAAQPAASGGGGGAGWAPSDVEEVIWRNRPPGSAEYISELGAASPPRSAAGKIQTGSR
eukprot:COSAG01_NODE_3078_length_6628_cov_30.180885_8_plen_93_part_00